MMFMWCTCPVSHDQEDHKVAVPPERPRFLSKSSLSRSQFSFREKPDDLNTLLKKEEERAKVLYRMYDLGESIAHIHTPTCDDRIALGIRSPDAHTLFTNPSPNTRTTSSSDLRIDDAAEARDPSSSAPASPELGARRHTFQVESVQLVDDPSIVRGQ